ncbi:MAG: hypothetical protein ACYC8T_22600 [Myxococcaceae bacterium]
MKRIPLTLVLFGSVFLVAGAPAAGKKAAPGKPAEAQAAPPKAAATSGKVSAAECQSYLDHLIDLHTADFVATDPELKAMSKAEKDATAVLIKAESAKQPELKAELQDCKSGEITRAEVECTMKASTAKASEKCAGL